MTETLVSNINQSMTSFETYAYIILFSGNKWFIAIRSLERGSNLNGGLFNFMTNRLLMSECFASHFSHYLAKIMYTYLYKQYTIFIYFNSHHVLTNPYKGHPYFTTHTKSSIFVNFNFFVENLFIEKTKF